MANLSIYGLTLLYDGTGTIFDELVLPTQFTDPTVLTDRLTLDTMELEVLYADPDVFKGALGIYSKSRLQTWQRPWRLPPAIWIGLSVWIWQPSVK